MSRVVSNSEVVDSATKAYAAALTSTNDIRKQLAENISLPPVVSDPPSYDMSSEVKSNCIENISTGNKVTRGVVDAGKAAAGVAQEFSTEDSSTGKKFGLPEIEAFH